MNLQTISDLSEEGVQMIQRRKIANYYMKKHGFAKKEAYETADKTQPEFVEARNLYLALFQESKPNFADRTEKEKALRVYQVFSTIALVCFVMWLFNNDYLSNFRVTDNFLLLALVINLVITSYFDEKVTERIHLRKTKELFRHEPESLQKLAQVEEIKRNIFRAEHRGLKLIKDQNEAEKQPQIQKSNRVLEKLKTFHNKIRK